MFNEQLFNSFTSSVKVKSLKTKLPESSVSSLVHVTVKSNSSIFSPTDGQYLWHFVLPRSTTVVSITIRVLPASLIMCQKSSEVDGKGPWVAIYLFIRSVPFIGIST